MISNEQNVLSCGHNVALLIVDVQVGFINEDTAGVPSLVEELQDSYKNVFISCFYNSQSSPYRRLMHWDKFEKEGRDYPLAFLPKDNAVIIAKNKYTCVDEYFINQLEKLNISEVHICGIDTDICVMKTAVDLFELGTIRPVVLVDYCASHGGQVLHDAALKILPRYIGQKQVYREVVKPDSRTLADQASP